MPVGVKRRYRDSLHQVQPKVLNTTGRLFTPVATVSGVGPLRSRTDRVSKPCVRTLRQPPGRPQTASCRGKVKITNPKGSALALVIR
jgi:hypothetical protein